MQHTVKWLISSWVSLAIAWPAASADLDCAAFTKEAAQARFVGHLRESGVPFTVDSAKGIGFRISTVDTDRFNHLFREASGRIDRDLITQEHQRGATNEAAKQRLRQSDAQLREALRIFPGSWPSLWTLGKIHQRLGDHSESLEWFLRAYEANPTQPDVAREAGLAALDNARHDDAVCLFTAALRASPSDAGIHANLALAHLLAGRLEDASTHAETAAQQEPSDVVSANVLRLVRDVQSGVRPQPENTADLQ